MSATPVALPASEVQWVLPPRAKVGMLSLILAESAIFSIFVVAYVFYIGKSLTGPTPREVLDVPILNTICLLSSSITIPLAVSGLRKGRTGAFTGWWLATIALGLKFVIGTGQEWHRLIYHDGLTIKTNLFGTTYYSLVGLHLFHVIVGLTMLSVVMAFALARKVKEEHSERVDALSLYWHFVDAVWVVVFTVVYIVGR